MKKLLVTILAFMCFFNVCSYGTNEIPKNLNNLFYIEEKQILKDEEFFKSFMKYPFLNIDKEIVIKEDYDSSFLEDINESIYSYINDFEKEIYLMASSYEKDYEKYKKENPNVIKYKFESFSDYNVTYNQDNYLSIPIFTYSFTGGAHGISYLKSFNYDLLNKKEIKINDLFKEDVDYKTVIKNFIKKEMVKNPNSYFLDSEININENQEFYLDKDGVVIYFQVYDIAPYYMGIVEFKMKFDEFKTIFK